MADYFTWGGSELVAELERRDGLDHHIRAVLSHYLDDEARHYEEAGSPQGHIYEHLLGLVRLVNEKAS